MKQFCKYQVKCKEDTKSTWTCTAHMHEGRAFECMYNSFFDAKHRQYPCEDAEKI
jgi:hypothetical protein